MQLEGVCSVERLHASRLGGGSVLQLARPVVGDELLCLCDALTSSSFRARAGSRSCRLRLCGYALRHGRLRGIRTSGVDLLPGAASLEFRAHPDRSSCSLLCRSEIGTLESVRVVPRVRCVIRICNG